jgi:hypothetical protein
MVLSRRNEPYFTSLFVEFVPPFFALLGWALGRDRRRNSAAGGAVVRLLLAFGRFTPVFALAYLLFAPLALVRFPLKMLVPALLLTAVCRQKSIPYKDRGRGNRWDSVPPPSEPDRQISRIICCRQHIAEDF